MIRSTVLLNRSQCERISDIRDVWIVFHCFVCLEQSFFPIRQYLTSGLVFIIGTNLPASETRNPTNCDVKHKKHLFSPVLARIRHQRAGHPNPNSQ